MFNRIELVAGILFTASLAAAIFLIQSKFTSTAVDPAEGLTNAQPAGIIFVDESVSSANVAKIQQDTKYTVDGSLILKSIIVDDIQVGTGEMVEYGDTVLVHYSGVLQDGLRFKNSRKRGEPFIFEVGSEQVIQGWNEGILGMKEGGERVLVIPPNKAYGDLPNGAIPAGSVLVFTIELLEVT